MTARGTRGPRRRRRRTTGSTPTQAKRYLHGFLASLSEPDPRDRVTTRKIAKDALTSVYLGDLVLHALQQALLTSIYEEIRELLAELDLWKNKQNKLMKFVEEYEYISSELPRIAELQIQPSLPYLLRTIEMSQIRGHAPSEEESEKMRERSEMLQLKVFGRLDP